MKARDVMTTQVVTVTPDTPVSAVASMMLLQDVSGLPVVDAAGRLRGIVSEGDLIRRAETGTDSKPRSWWLRLVGNEAEEARDYIKTHGATAGDVMSHPVETVRPDDDIAKVALLLERRRIKRVPVVSEGKVVGVVSRADLLRGLATRGTQDTPAPADDRDIREALVQHLAEQSWAASAVVKARNTAGARDVEDHLSRSVPT
jgi:CBS domain-containing protein